MAKLDMQTLTKSVQIIGQDKLVELKLLQPGIVVGTWRVIRFVIVIYWFIVAGKVR